MPDKKQQQTEQESTTTTQTEPVPADRMERTIEKTEKVQEQHDREAEEAAKR